jgi:hypothetical protein
MTNQTPLPHAVELLPCPFCGRVGLTFEEGSTYRWGIASCEWCGATAGETRRAYPDDGKWHADAIAAWNKRATPAQAAPEAVSRHAPQARALLDIAQYLAGHLQMVQDRIDAALATPSAVPSPSTADDERKAFEGWVNRERPSLWRCVTTYIEHADVHVLTAAWEAWQARAALSTEHPSEPQKAKDPGAHTEASEAGQEPPTHDGSVEPGEGLL